MIDRSIFRVSDTATGSCFISTFPNNLFAEIWCSISKSFSHVSVQCSNFSQGLWFVQDLRSELPSQNVLWNSALRQYQQFFLSLFFSSNFWSNAQHVWEQSDGTFFGYLMYFREETDLKTEKKHDHWLWSIFRMVFLIEYLFNFVLWALN